LWTRGKGGTEERRREDRLGAVVVSSEKMIGIGFSLGEEGRRERRARKRRRKRHGTRRRRRHRRQACRRWEHHHR